MYKRAEELFEIYWKSIGIGWKPNFDKIERPEQLAWYDVAKAEAYRLSLTVDVWKSEIDRMRNEMATMVKRKHYNDAIKSLATCQQQIETLVVELRKHDPDSAIAHDAAIVMDLIEAMIVLNPDMQTEDWKADQKVKQDRRDAEYRVAEEKRRAVVQAAMWKDEPSYGSGWVRGAVGKGRKP